MKHPRMFLRDNDSRKFSREDLFAEVPAGSHYSYSQILLLGNCYIFLRVSIFMEAFAVRTIHGSFRGKTYSWKTESMRSKTGSESRRIRTYSSASIRLTALRGQFTENLKMSMHMVIVLGHNV